MAGYYAAAMNFTLPDEKEIRKAFAEAEEAVVMDFPANTIAQRQWLKSIFSQIDAAHELI